MAKHREVKFQAMSMINDDDDDEMPILPCAEKLELVLSTAPKKHQITPTKTVKIENGPISRGSQSEVIPQGINVYTGKV